MFKKLLLSLFLFTGVANAQTYLSITRVLGPCAASTAVIYDFTNKRWVCGSGAVGTVTNFSAGDLSPIFTTSEATTTTTPALTFTLSTQSANRVFAGPTSGGAAIPTFRLLVDDDIPAAVARDSELPTVFYHTVDDEDVALTQRRVVNFEGAGVTCADDTDQTTCTIPGSAGSGYDTIEDEDTPLTQRTDLNFEGTGVTCADDGGTKTTCTITAGSGDIEGVTAGDGLTDGGTSGTVILNVAVTSPLTVAADSVGMVNQGTATTVLHGNAAGNPSFSAVVTNDITNSNITYAKIQDVTNTDRVLGRSSGGAGVVEEITFNDFTQDHASTTFSDDQIFVADSATGGTPRTVPDCQDSGGNHLNYTQSTNTLSCGTSSSGGGGADPVDIQLFEVADSGTNWTLPTGFTWIEVISCGSGGGGGGGSGAAVSNARTGGGGGGGGFCWKKAFQASDISSPVTVTVGAGGNGGTGGTAGSGTDGATGNTSSFGTYLIAYGGGGGAGHNAGAAGGGGGGCGAVGASATTTSGVAGGECVLASAANTTYADCRGAGTGNTQAAGNGGRASDCGGGSGSTSSSTGGGGTLAGGKSRLSSGGGGHGGGVNNANPGTAQDGQAGGDAGNMSTSLNGSGGAAGLSASDCGAGGEGQPGNTTINSWRPGGQGGGGGASKNSTTGCNGGNGGYGGGGGGGGGGGTNTGGNGGSGGPGYVLIISHN